MQDIWKCNIEESNKTYKYDPSLQVILEKNLKKTKLGYPIGPLKATLSLQLINLFVQISI